MTGGKQASSVLTTVKRDDIERKGGMGSTEEEGASETPLHTSGTTASSGGHPRTFARRLSITQNALIPDVKFGVFQMGLKASLCV